MTVLPYLFTAYETLKKTLPEIQRWVLTLEDGTELLDEHVNDPTIVPNNTLLVVNGSAVNKSQKTGKCLPEFWNCMYMSYLNLINNHFSFLIFRGEW